jgi:transposase
MIIGSHHFESYLKCPTKCWLQSRAEPPAENPYAHWASAQNGTYFRAGLKRLVDTFPESACVTAPPSPNNPKQVDWRLAIDVRWKTRDLETCLQAVERVPGKGRGRPATFIPYRFESLNKITREHRLLLAFDTQRERVYVKSGKNPSRKPRRRAAIRSALTPNTTAEYPRPSSCPKCNSVLLQKQILTSRNVIDLRFTRHGIKRWITRHLAYRYECQSCGSTFLPLDRCFSKSKYGPNIIAYSVYLNIELRLPQERVNSHLSKSFGLSFPSASKFKMQAAEAYRSAYDSILKGLCGGRLLHVDETSISVRGRNGYVWVLTSMEEVAYFYTPTREGSTIQTMLKDFSGVLVSDFYTAYDAIDCPQQKCLVHFIRDLNDDLLKHPYDDVLKRLGREFVCLVKPMIETVDHYGLKRRFLNKHRISVDRFYRKLSEESGAGEAATKVVERLKRNRDTMFTFLNFDDVPWNNNNAEHAIKAFATLRRVIDGVTTEKGLQDFLILLSLCETCKYKHADFLGFLRSGLENIDDFANSRRSGA